MRNLLVALALVVAGVVVAGSTEAQEKMKLPLGLQADAVFIPNDNP